jgi:glycosyltransferase involved in cell wall biosynthesis
MRSPEVSVVIPVYNGASTIRNALHSVLRQTYTDFEVLMIDDGSSDTSVSLVLSLGDERFRLIQHSRNQGLEATRNELVGEARGRYLAWLDQDDAASPTRLAEQVAFLSRFANLGACGTWARATPTSAGARLKHSSRHYRYVVRSRYLRFWQLFENQVATSSCMMRASAAKGLEFKAGLSPTEDWAYWNEIGFSSGLANIPKYLTRLTLNSQSYSERDRAKQERAWDYIWVEGFRRLGLSLTSKDLESHRALTYYSQRPSEDLDRTGVKEWCRRLGDWAQTMSEPDRRHFTSVLQYFMLRFEWRTRGSGNFVFDSNTHKLKAADTSVRLFLGQKTPLARLLN